MKLRELLPFYEENYCNCGYVPPCYAQSVSYAGAVPKKRHRFFMVSDRHAVSRTVRARRIEWDNAQTLEEREEAWERYSEAYRFLYGTNPDPLL